MGEAETGGAEKPPAPLPPDPPAPPVEEPVVWSPEVEVCLFHAMLGHKPVGVNRHFHMICIRDKFSQNIGRQISSKVIWDHLGTMYDMQALVISDRDLKLYVAEHKKVLWSFSQVQLQVQGAYSLSLLWTLPKEVNFTVKINVADPLTGLRGQPGVPGPQHESEILPFPNSEKNFILPEEIIHELKEGKVASEEEVKEEIKEEAEVHASIEEVLVPTVNVVKTSEKPVKEKERTSSDSSSKDGGDKRKRSRVTDKVLSANSNPSSPSAAKRRRT